MSVSVTYLVHGTNQSRCLIPAVYLAGVVELEAVAPAAERLISRCVRPNTMDGAKLSALTRFAKLSGKLPLTPKAPRRLGVSSANRCSALLFSGRLGDGESSGAKATATTPRNESRPLPSLAMPLDACSSLPTMPVPRAPGRLGSDVARSSAAPRLSARCLASADASSPS